MIGGNESKNLYNNEAETSDFKDNQVHEASSDNTFRESTALRLNFQNKLESFNNVLIKELGYS
jgi:hypothetical protein